VKPETTFAIATAPKRNSRHWKLGTVTWGEILTWVDEPGKVKEAGNYVLGTLRETSVAHDKARPTERCTGLHRRKDAIVSRSALTLDVDSPDPDFAEKVELVFPYALLMHTTFSSAPDAPRWRMIIPTDRELAPDEYIAATQAVMVMLGEEQFDPGTTQPERYMFRPATPNRAWFESFTLDGDPLPVDDFLTSFETDLSSKPTPRPHHNKRNPFEIEGVIGAFNRAYADWDLLIDTYDLPYEKVDEDRYQLVGARSMAGMGPIADTEGLVFSHHASDPAYGKACSAFDLARMHLFGELDEEAEPRTPVNKLPSHVAMLEVASTDHRVTAELVGLDFDDLTDDEGNLDLDGVDDAWLMRLARNNRGKILDTVGNRDLFKAHEPVFQLLYFNELTFTVEVAEDLPWRKVTERNRPFVRVDRIELNEHLERTYGIGFTTAKLEGMVDSTAMQRLVNPVRHYLEGLTWDGVSRMETALPGVRPTPFTRLVARKVLVAAVARMLDPGVKWDHTLVLYGAEGLGKSWWIDRMSKGYSNSLGDITNKDTLITMQRSWIMIADEGHSLRKADADMQKEFLTRTHDTFRLPYEREALVHPRHSVIWSTTNDETFLRRQEGNRRFLIVHCQDKVDFDRMTDHYVDQVWAEAVVRYKQGEPLFLEHTESELAALERERYVEEDALGGVIAEYLDTPVPDDWDELSPESRVAWLDAFKSGFEQPGTGRINEVCSTQVWVEALRRRIGDHRRVDLLDITNVLKRLEGWRQKPGRSRLPGYGPQMVFERLGDDIQAELDDLI
jgi:putative DNA primase/helicase